MFQGKDGFVWFMGIVEDRNDPLYLNRVRIRIYGAHTDDKQLIATPDLPWSEVMMPVTSPSLSGLGTTTHGLVEGSTIMGFYRDGMNQQDPVVMGSFIGMPQEHYKINQTIDDKGQRADTLTKRSPDKGFNDPRLDTEKSYDETLDGPSSEANANLTRNYGLTLALDKSPRRDGNDTGVSYPKTEYILKTDVNYLAQGETTEYPKIELSKGEPDRTNYVEPIYPFNHVHETESGHVVELDDTPDKERIHLYHRKGTRYEIDNAGTVIEKIVKDKYTVILGENKVKIQGAVDIEVGDSLVGNTIAAAGGSEKLTSDAVKSVIDEDGFFTATTVEKLHGAGLDVADIAGLQGKLNDSLIDSTQEAIGNLADEESLIESALDVVGIEPDTAVDKVGFKTVIDTVTAIDSKTEAGVDSIVKSVSESVGGLSTDAQNTISDALSGIDSIETSVTDAINLVENKLNNLKDEALKKLGVDKVKEKLTAKLTEVTASVEVLQAEVTAKVSEAVTSVATDILGPELGAKIGGIVTEQMTNAVTTVALSALGGVLGSNLVNVTVAGSAKIKTMGSTTVQSLGGSTNITSAMSTNITTLTGATNITTAVGTTNITNGLGAINLAAPITNIVSPVINTTGILNHTGVMNVTGASNFTGLLTGTAIVSPLITSGATNLATHTHTILTGSSTGQTGPGLG